MAKRIPPFVGLEIEPSAVHAASVAVNGTLSVKTAAVAALEAGVVRDGEVTDVAALTEVLKALWAENKDLPKRVRIGIANQKIVVRVIELPPIADAKELAAAVHFQAQNEIPMPLDAAVLDFQVLDVVDTPNGPRQRVVLVAARRDMVDRVLAAARDAGLRVEGLDLAAFGMVRALAGQGGSALDDTVLYLGIGGLTNLAVAQGTTCTFTRVVGGGIEALAVELAERRGLTLEHARGWLLHVGFDAPLTDMDGDELILQEARTILVDGVRRIAGEVRNTVDFHLSQGATGGGATRCVLTGAAAGIPGFAEALAVDLGLPVTVGTVDGAPEALGAERFSVAAGLAVEVAA
ncbi:MAG: pilM [Solirubrobacterales bacterium]|jgi:type IV pilus assembly protein PilM|nr:pilM [Solirubrobacterales bacterium]